MLAWPLPMLEMMAWWLQMCMTKSINQSITKFNVNTSTCAIPMTLKTEVYNCTILFYALHIRIN